MRRFSLITLACVVTLASALLAQQTNAVTAAANALGAAKINTLQFMATGRNFSVGQNATPTEPWPPVTLKSYTETINYNNGQMRVDMVREMGAVMPRGGGAPFYGEQRLIQEVSGAPFHLDDPLHFAGAWNQPPSAPGAPIPTAQPQPGATADRMLQLLATPHGFLKAAMANNATSRAAAGGTEVSFTVSGKYKMTGTINAQNQVERVQTWIDSPVLGDMLVETVFSGYRDFGGVQFPSHIVQNQGGYPSLDLTVSDVKANPPVEIVMPQIVSGWMPPPGRVDSQKVADGVYYLTGGSHHSVAIEMRDHIVIVEGPLTEERGLAVIAKVKELVPNKPIRFVINTHHHWDHSGGLRPFVDAGITVVTQQINKPFYETAWAAPRTLNPDRLAQSKKAPTFMTVGDKAQLTDGSRTIELHRLTNYTHTDDMLVAYLPKEKILIEADAFTPLPATAKLVPPALPAAKALADNIQRLKLDVGQILALHGPGVATMADLTGTITRSSTN